MKRACTGNVRMLVWRAAVAELANGLWQMANGPCPIGYLVCGGATLWPSALELHG
jgi:hypothetical protein